MPRISGKCHWPALAVLAALLHLHASVRAAGTPAWVDLREWQTPIRIQHGGNCFIYGTVAALEARLKRDGYGELDLSEHFSDYMGCLFFLETCEMNGPYRTATMRIPPAGERETSLAADLQPTIESGSPCERLRIPEERYFPWIAELDHPTGPADSRDPHWNRQYDVGTYNLDSNRLPRTALTAQNYYGIEHITWLAREEASQPEALERVLARGREVIWDFKQSGDVTSHPWRYTGPADPNGMAHRMLLVGYDRRDPDHPYFIAKNSWGAVTNEGSHGFTFIEYEFIKYGEWASYIDRIKAPAPWPELQFIGRWDARLGERSGTLDLYHLPGLMKQTFERNQYLDRDGRVIRDQRLGTFYLDDNPDRAFHVNGNVSRDKIQLWIDFINPTRRWDELTGSAIELRMDSRHALIGHIEEARGKRKSASATLRTFASILPAAAPAPTSAAPDPVPPGIQSEFEVVWQKEGGSSGALGIPTGEIIRASSNSWMQTYERGVIYFTEGEGPRIVHSHSP